ncbi:YwdI family protein [Bacillus sp. B15-48]|uniref:DUF5327 family protein n=1 Tax=Bacillus sp. B15-48 TaxID=1548601 RepID=UPI00193EC5CB|nr:hypothetical protein [Bacillus sp. B15-48]
MDIPIQKLLTKMDAELQAAKHAKSNAAIREKIHALKTLCELVLDEPVSNSDSKQNHGFDISREVPRQTQLLGQAQIPRQSQIPILMQTQIPAQSPNQGKKLEMDDGANGDSLFEF